MGPWGVGKEGGTGSCVGEGARITWGGGGDILERCRFRENGRNDVFIIRNLSLSH